MIKKFRILFTICSCVLFLHCKPTKETVQIPDIIDKPIVFDETRKQLTLEYLKNRYGLIQETTETGP